MRFRLARIPNLHGSNGQAYGRRRNLRLLEPRAHARMREDPIHKDPLRTCRIVMVDRFVAVDDLAAARESWALPVLSHGLLYVGQNSRDVMRRDPPRLLCYDLRGE